MKKTFDAIRGWSAAGVLALLLLLIGIKRQANTL